MNDEILSTREAADILNLGQAAISRLLRIGKLEGRRIGREWIVYRSSVEAYLEQIEGKSKNDPTRGTSLGN